MAKGTSSVATRRTVTSERAELDPVARQWGALLRSIRSRADDGSGTGTKFTQETFAAKLGVPQSTVSRWESGARMPRDGKRQAIAEALGINPDLLFSLPPRMRRSA